MLIHGVCSIGAFKGMDILVDSVLKSIPGRPTYTPPSCTVLGTNSTCQPYGSHAQLCHAFLVLIVIYNSLGNVTSSNCFSPLFHQCFDAVGWAAGRVSGL